MGRNERLSEKSNLLKSFYNFVNDGSKEMGKDVLGI
jgi:hypothetical protein